MDGGVTRVVSTVEGDSGAGYHKSENRDIQ